MLIRVQAQGAVYKLEETTALIRFTTTCPRISPFYAPLLHQNRTCDPQGLGIYAIRELRAHPDLRELSYVRTQAISMKGRHWSALPLLYLSFRRPGGGIFQLHPHVVLYYMLSSDPPLR